MPRLEVLRCPSCGAPVARDTLKCPYCSNEFVPTTNRAAPSAGPAPQSTSGARSDSWPGMAFRRETEPNENAFSLAVPTGWTVEGGIARADLTRQMISAQVIEAKLDFSVKRDPSGTVSIRWCPEIKYRDMRLSPAGMMGMYPPGSNVGGLIVMPLMPAQAFLMQIVFPWAHPQATDISILQQRPEPLLIQAYHQRMAAFGLPARFEYDAGVVTFGYTEDGQRYEERAYTIIESMGMMGAGMWSNKDTLLVRSPDGELAQWEPLLHHIRESVVINPEWLAGEIVSQEFLSRTFLSAQQAEQARNRRMLEIQQQIQQMDRQITEHRARTNAEIHNDAYLTLMDQEEYINPFSNEPETGSNQWQHRWVTDGGEEYYTDTEDDDPNIAGVFNRSDWQRTYVRPRSPNG